MSLVLFVDKVENLRELYAFEIEAVTDLQVLEFDSVEEAHGFFKENGERVSLVVCDQDIDSGLGKVLYEDVFKLNPRLPFIVLADRSAQLPWHENWDNLRPANCLITRPIGVDAFLENVRSLLKDYDINESEFADYCKVSVDRFKYFNLIPFDVFIDLGGGNKVKILSEGELYDDSFLNKYKNRGVSYFYIPEKDFMAFRKLIFDHLISEMQRAKTYAKPFAERIQVKEEVLNLAHELVIEMGIDRSLAESIQAVVEESLDEIASIPELAELLEDFLTKDNFLVRHSILISYFAGALAHGMRWSSRQTLRKLTLASFLHDIYLDNNELALIHNINSSEFKELNSKEQESVKGHALKMAMALRRNSSILTDVDHIIQDHHEKPDGSGFPRGLRASQIFPLSCLFILAEEFVFHLYNQKLSEDLLDGLLGKIKQGYMAGSFKGMISSCERLIESMKENLQR